MAELASRERVVEALSYSPETGRFLWLINRGQIIKAGDPAGSKTSKGYIAIHLDGREYRAHRLAWLIVNGNWPAGEIDHINGNRDDNRLANIRDVSPLLNRLNRCKPHARSASGLLGVQKMKSGKWSASIGRNGVSKHLGVFLTANEAHSAYVAARAEEGIVPFLS